MRIIAGHYRGHGLVAPRGSKTRPTSDRVRESVFATLERYGIIHDAHVMDIFAGSGALGCEAISRGSASVTFVDNSRGAAAAITANIEKLGIRSQTRMVCASASAELTRSKPGSVDLIFADPPYVFGMAQIHTFLRLCAPVLSGDDAVIVLEQSARSEPPCPVGASLRLSTENHTAVELELFREKTYGETVIRYFQLAGRYDKSYESCVSRFL